MATGCLPFVSATEITGKEKEQILLSLMSAFLKGNAYNVNWCSSALQLLSNKEIQSATTRYEFVDAVNRFFKTIPVSHFYLLDACWHEDIHSLEKMGFIDHLYGDNILQCRFEGDIVSKRFKVSKVLPGIMPSPIQKNDEVLQVSDIQLLKPGLNLWSKARKLCPGTYALPLVNALKILGLNFQQIESKDDLNVPGGKIRFAIYTRDKKIFVAAICPDPVPASMPAQELSFVDGDIPLISIKSFSTGQEMNIKKFYSAQSESFRFIQSYDRKAMKAILEQVQDKSHMILDLRDNGGGEFAESNILAWSSFSAPMAVVKVSAGGGDVKYNYQDLQKAIRDNYKKYQKTGQTFEEAFLNVESSAFPVAPGKPYYCSSEVSWKDYFPKFNGKVVILMNQHTASAAEFFIHQMKVRLGDRCILIGEKTAGAATESAIIPLSAGVVVSMPQTERVPIAGEQERIEQVGLNPDIAVKNSIIADDVKDDPCILAAIKALEEKK